MRDFLAMENCQRRAIFSAIKKDKADPHCRISGDARVCGEKIESEWRYVILVHSGPYLSNLGGRVRYYPPPP